MGRRKRRKGTLNFREWDIHKPIMFLGRGAITRGLSESVVSPKGPKRNPLQPFLKHLTKTERKERHFVSTIATKVPIPIPGVELVPLEEYNNLYPKVYDKKPPLIVEQPEVKSLSDEKYSRLYPSVYDKMPASRIKTLPQSHWLFEGKELYCPDLRSLPKPEVEHLKEKDYNKLYPPVYDKMPSSRIEDLIEKLVRQHIKPGKRNPIVLLKKEDIFRPSVCPHAGSRSLLARLSQGTQ